MKKYILLKNQKMFEELKGEIVENIEYKWNNGYEVYFFCKSKNIYKMWFDRDNHFDDLDKDLDNILLGREIIDVKVTIVKKSIKYKIETGKGTITIIVLIEKVYFEKLN